MLGPVPEELTVISRLFALALGLGLALCTVSYAGPEAKLKTDAGYDNPGVGQWFDLLLTVDPKGEVLAAEGLKVTAKGACSLRWSCTST